MITTLLTILHVLVCVSMLPIILLQSGKGGGMGLAFGTSSQTVFGSRGAGNFLTKLTSIAAIIFMCTSLALAWTSSHKRSVVLRDTGRGAASSTEGAKTSTAAKSGTATGTTAR